ncbi:MAG: hypothetical protein WC677_07620 [Clostridia bacterium]|jgi:hypothetical protein
MLTKFQIFKIEACISQVVQELRRGYVSGSNIHAFDEGYKLFVLLDYNLYTDEMYTEFQNRLLSFNILSEKVYYALQSASNMTPGVVFWKKL